MEKARKARRGRREYTLEFQRDAVALSGRPQSKGRSLAAIARDLGVLPQTLRVHWRSRGSGLSASSRE